MLWLLGLIIDGIVEVVFGATIRGRCDVCTVEVDVDPNVAANALEMMIYIILLLFFLLSIVDVALNCSNKKMWLESLNPASRCRA